VRSIALKRSSFYFFFVLFSSHNSFPAFALLPADRATSVSARLKKGCAQVLKRQCVAQVGKGLVGLIIGKTEMDSNVKKKPIMLYESNGIAHLYICIYILYYAAVTATSLQQFHNY